MNTKKEFLKDVVVYTLSAFGGPQAHLAIMLRQFVYKKNYLSEPELMELNALAQFLPGPSSSQTLAGIAYKIGGLWYALGVYVIWILPSTILMLTAALYFKELNHFVARAHVLVFIEWMAIGFVAYAAFALFRKNLTSGLTFSIAVFAGLISWLVNSAFIFPLLMILGGTMVSVIKAGEAEKKVGTALITNLNPMKLFYFLGIFVFFALVGALVNRTSPFSLPIRLFQNFYRNGIFIYGGGQVLIPYLYTEMVEMKHYLNPQEFLFGYGIQQAIPGPVFSFTSYIGARVMGNSGFKPMGQFAGSLLAVVGINAPGLILMLFILPFWNNLKQITRIKNALIGVNAVSVGFIVASVFLLLRQVPIEALGIGVIFATFSLLAFTRIPAPVVMVAGIVAGFIV